MCDLQSVPDPTRQRAYAHHIRARRGSAWRPKSLESASFVLSRACTAQVIFGALDQFFTGANRSLHTFNNLPRSADLVSGLGLIFLSGGLSLGLCHLADSVTSFSSQRNELSTPTNATEVTNLQKGFVCSPPVHLFLHKLAIFDFKDMVVQARLSSAV